MNKLQDELFNYCKNLKKVSCRIEEFEIVNCDNGEIAIRIHCNQGPHVFWSFSGTLLASLMNFFNVKEWSKLKHRYCYILYSDDDFFKGVAQMEPDGYTHLFFTQEKVKGKYITKWWHTEYLSFKNFKLVSQISEK